MKLVHIIDDHLLFSQSLEMLINRFEDYKVDFCGRNGSELIHRLQDCIYPQPDLILLDINMPIMNGLETIAWLKKNQPNLPVLALTMEDEDMPIICMLKNGAKGYLLKDMHPDILKQAMDDVITLGFYQSERVSKLLLNNLLTSRTNNVQIKEKEMEFIKLACSEMTYKEIAEQMHLSPKTIDGYREQLFEKLEVKSRVGLVMYAIKHKMVLF